MRAISLAHPRRLCCGAALLLGVAALAPFGCTAKTVRPVERRIVQQRSDPDAGAEREDVAKEYEQRLRNDPNNPKWYFELGAVYEMRRDYERAEALYRQGAKYIDAGHYTGPDMAIARVLIKQGKLDDAVHHLQRVVAVPPRSQQQLVANPDYRDAYYLLGAIYFNRGDVDAAREAFRSFLRLGGDKERVVPYFPKLVAESPAPPPVAPK